MAKTRGSLVPIVLPIPSLPQRVLPEYHRHLLAATAGRISPTWGTPSASGATHTVRKTPLIHINPFSANAYSEESEKPSSRIPATASSSAPTHSKASVYRKPVLPESPAKRRATLSAAPLASSTKLPTSTAVNTRQLRNDRLGTLVRQLDSDLDASASWEGFVSSFRGRSYLAPELEGVDHPAADLLRLWREHGVPANTTSEPWTDQELDSCVERGCHRSATEHADFLREEMSEFIENKFWTVLPYDRVRHLPGLQLSPAAVKDERDRKPRLLCDHSWYPVNDTTSPHAPPEAMQFGGALHRVLRRVRHANPKFGPVYLAKHDIKDGFYRMFLKASDCPRLAIILPKYDGETQLIAIPMSCTMGWSQSPPTFSVMSETVTDITNANFQRRPREANRHRLEEHASALDNLSCEPLARGEEDSAATTRLRALNPKLVLAEEDESSAPPSNQMYSRPVGDTDVFVDDFIQLGQGGSRRLKALRGHLLRAIDQVLSRPNADETHRNEAISLKKLLKGDGSWNTRKLILGWIVDSIRQTIELPAHRKETLASIFEELASLKRVNAKKWASFLGRLRFVSVAIPGSGGLFSALQWAQNKAKGNRIRVTRFVRDSLDAFSRLATSLCHRPTKLAEIVPQEPSLLGATDAAKAGMGGVYFDPAGVAYVWRAPFPDHIRKRLVSTGNPTGDVTNSDLEHAALLGQVDLMTTTHDTRYATLENFSDNTPAVSRVRKGAVSTCGAAAALCRFASDHQRLHRYCHLAHFLPGDINSMADDASRLQHLSDAAFLAHFEQLYPQAQPWVLLRLRHETYSLLTSALLSRSPGLPTPEKRTKPATPSSALGKPSARPLESVLTSKASGTPKLASPTSSSSASATDKEGRPVRSLSQLIQSRTPYWRWGRGLPTWVNRIPERKLLDPSETIPYSLLSSRPSATKMTLPNAPTPQTSPSSGTCPTSSTPKTRTLAGPTPRSLTSPSLPSTGSFARRNTPIPTPSGALKHSAFGTPSSTWEIVS